MQRRDIQNISEITAILKTKLPSNISQSSVRENPFAACKKKCTEVQKNVEVEVKNSETDEEIEDQVHLCLEDVKEKVVMKENEIEVMDDEFEDVIFLQDDDD